MKKNYTIFKMFFLATTLLSFAISVTWTNTQAMEQSDFAPPPPPPPPPPMPDLALTRTQKATQKLPKKQQAAKKEARLLEEIQQGVALKPVNKTPQTGLPIKPRDQMLQQIQKGVQLKKVDKTPQPQQAPTTQHGKLIEEIKKGVILKPVDKKPQEALPPSTPQEKLLDDIRKGVVLKKVPLPPEKPLSTDQGQPLPTPQNDTINTLITNLGKLQIALDACKATAHKLQQGS